MSSLNKAMSENMEDSCSVLYVQEHEKTILIVIERTITQSYNNILGVTQNNRCKEFIKLNIIFINVIKLPPPLTTTTRSAGSRCKYSSCSVPVAG